LPGGSNPTAATGRHTVEKGQNLFRIAQLYGSTVDELKRLNGLEGDAVKIGQQLIVPSRGSAAQPPKEAVKKLPVPVEDDRPEKTAPSQPVYHVVQKGEFLNGIARKHGTSAAALVKLNGLADADQIRPGQKLRVK
jgi:LysM repeat protein